MNSVPAEHVYFRRARFALSTPEYTGLPADEGAEIVVIGRSNVGKSSVLNALCDQRGLARTSRTPGRTQHIVVFDLGDARRLLDLPGYGYAAVRRDTRAGWDEAIPRLLESRRSLAGLLLLADIRHPLQEEELTLLRWALEADLPVQLGLNKADKLGRQALLGALREARAHVAPSGTPVAPLAVSALGGDGIADLRRVLHGWFEAKKKEGPGVNSQGD